MSKEPWVPGEGYIGVPKHLKNIPVKQLNRFADWSEELSEETVREISIAGALVFGSVLCGRRYISCNSNTTALQLAVIAPTGGGKNFIKQAIQMALFESGQKHLVGGGNYTSEAAIRSMLMQSPTKVSIIDEFGDKLRAATKAKESQQERAFEALKEIYSDADGLWMKNEYSAFNKSDSQIEQQNSSDIHCPSLTVIGLSTKGQMMDALNDSHIEGGYVNRMVFVDASNEGFRERNKINKSVPGWIPKFCEQVRGISSESYKEKPEWIDVNFEDDVHKKFSSLKKDIRSKFGSDDTTFSLTRRWRENAMRISTMLAACDNPKHPYVTMEIAEWAIDYVCFHGERFISLVSNNRPASLFERNKNAFLNALRAAGQNGISLTRMGRIAPFRAFKSREKMEILKELAIDDLAYSVVDRESTARKKPVTWYATRN